MFVFAPSIGEPSGCEYVERADPDFADFPSKRLPQAEHWVARDELEAPHSGHCFLLTHLLLDSQNRHSTDAFSSHSNDNPKEKNAKTPFGC